MERRIAGARSISDLGEFSHPPRGDRVPCTESFDHAPVPMLLSRPPHCGLATATVELCTMNPHHWAERPASQYDCGSQMGCACISAGASGCWRRAQRASPKCPHRAAGSQLSRRVNRIALRVGKTVRLPEWFINHVRSVNVVRMRKPACSRMQNMRLYLHFPASPDRRLSRFAGCSSTAGRFRRRSFAFPLSTLAAVSVTWEISDPCCIPLCSRCQGQTWRTLYCCMSQPHICPSLVPSTCRAFALQLESMTHVASCRQIASDLHGAFRQQHMLRRVIDIIVQYNAAAVYSHFCRAEVSEYTPRQLRRM
jgi:hypothetical protein